VTWCGQSSIAAAAIGSGGKGQSLHICHMSQPLNIEDATEWKGAYRTISIVQYAASRIFVIASHVQSRLPFSPNFYVLRQCPRSNLHSTNVSEC
jgi:hypothetical protein